MDYLSNECVLFFTVSLLPGFVHTREDKHSQMHECVHTHKQTCVYIVIHIYECIRYVFSISLTLIFPNSNVKHKFAPL